MDRPKGRVWEALKRQVYAEESVCWICRQPVNLQLRGRTKWSRSVDHVKPFVKFPELALVRSNLRLAHYGCNSQRSARGDEPVGPDQSREW